jgi:DNA polymerase-3 subunit epsilon
MDLLAITRPLLLFDTETTGPNPAQDRICELGFILIKPDGTVKEWQGYINPTVPIPHEASHGNGKDYPGHGITDEMVKDAPTFARLAENLHGGFTGCDFGGFNLKHYDLPLMQAEFERTGMKWSYDDARILDGYRLWQVGQARTLSDASEYFLGRKAEGAHRALYDVQVSRDVIMAQILRFNLPRSVQSLHDLQWPRDPNAVDRDGKILWNKDGEAVINFGKKWKGTLLRMMKQRDLNWIATEATGINMEARRICAEAAKGNFPRRAQQ